MVNISKIWKIPASVVSFWQGNRREEETLQNLELLRMILLIFVSSSSNTGLAGLVFYFVTGNVAALGVAIIAFIVGIIYLADFFYANPKSESNIRRFKIASYILLINLLVALSLGQFLLGTGGVLTASFMLIPILAGIVKLSFREVMLFLFLTLVSFVAFYLMQRFSVYTPILAIEEQPYIDLPFWVITFILIGGCILIFLRRLQSTNQSLLTQGERLNETLATLQNVFEKNGILSSEVSRATSELSANAQQQASNTQEQVAAVTQVTSSLEELGETAQQIAGSASSAASSATQMSKIAGNVNEVSETAQRTADEGNQAVTIMLNSVKQVRTRIEIMGQRLLNLTEQNRKVASIIDIIETIADETHLLSLNASIEAAGGVYNESLGSASVGNTATATRGQRFGVISQEIKNLADRSRESTEEVRQAIAEMQGAVAAAVLVAEEGKKATAEAMARAEIAQHVISRLYEVINLMITQFQEVVTASFDVTARCEEIRVATGQQRTANIQVLQTMRNINTISQQTSTALVELSTTIKQIDLRVEDLNEGLNNSLVAASSAR